MMLFAIMLSLMNGTTPAGTGVVPVHDIEKGEVLVAGDLVASDRTSLPAQAVIGREAARRLAAGSPLKAYDLIRPQMVKRGMPVTLVILEGAITITSPGRALSAGSTDETVRVVSTVTNRTLEGRVEGQGRVRITGN